MRPIGIDTQCPYFVLSMDGMSTGSRSSPHGDFFFRVMQKFEIQKTFTTSVYASTDSTEISRSRKSPRKIYSQFDFFFPEQQN
jgi:hypothetical protein